MSRPSQVARAAALALVFALPGCFEVPPLPDTVPGCGGGGACNADEICRDDGDCAPNDVVTFDLHCEGVPGTILGLGCGGETGFVQCSENGVSTVVDCPLNALIQVCCGTARGCQDDPPVAVLDRDIALGVDPPDGWNCTFGDDNGNAEICAHAGFSASPRSVGFIDCETTPTIPGVPE